MKNNVMISLTSIQWQDNEKNETEKIKYIIDMINDINNEPVLEKAEAPAPEKVDSSGEMYTCKSCGNEMLLSEMNHVHNAF